jgi:predicted O-linked N-acetylglucosamine transferase (SPINDLY family)
MTSKIQRMSHRSAFDVEAGAWPAEAQPAVEVSPEAQEQSLLAALAVGDGPTARTLALRLTARLPERGVPWKVLGALLWAEGQVLEAVAAMQKSVMLLPRDAEAHCNLGTSLSKLDRFADAEVWLRQAIEIDPHFATAHYRLGMTYSQQSKLHAAVSSLRTGLALKCGYAEGDDAQNHSNLLFILGHLEPADPERLFDEHRRFAENFENSATWPRHTNGKDPDRSLKIGFVSGDLREHAVSYFFEPMLARLGGHPSLELHAYSNSAVADEVSHRLRKHFRDWQDICALSDAQLASKIAADRIDILVDLSGHTALNRLAAFARKPAPIQVSWIGYPGTTGLSAVDYYFADRRWLPAGRFDSSFSEKLAYLPDRWTFQQHTDAPSVSALPAKTAGRLTFGSFNRADKITDATVQLWSRVLRAMPDSGMVIGGIRLESQRQALIAAFEAAGVAGGRLTFHEPSDMAAHLSLYRFVDICLDTTPYNGGTMTLHALCMGVPTLTIAGATPMARAGVGILENVGLGAFVARDAAEFVDKARYWADHTDELAHIRLSMRARLREAPVGQPDLMALHVVAALRHMWKRWCLGLPVESFDSAAALNLATDCAPVSGTGAASTNAAKLDTACAKAMDLQLAGHLDLARQLYEAILQAAPQHAAANYGVGMLEVQSQRPEDGLPYLKAALQSQLDVSDYWLGYLEALKLAGRTEAARSILALGRQQGLTGHAVDDFSRRLESRLDAERRDQESALQSLFDRQDHAGALPLARRIAERFPQSGVAWKLLGALLSFHDDPQTVAAMRTAARLLPQDVEAQVNLGLTLAKMECFEEAEAYLQKALELNPTFASTHYRLAITYELQGRFADAEASLRRGIALRTGYAAREDEQCHSNLLFLMGHNQSIKADELFAEHCRYGEYFERSLRASWPRHANNRDPQRRLKVGFVSGDLFEHSVANFIGPILAQLKDSPDLELHVYYTNTLHDEVSKRLQGFCRHWNTIRDLSDVDLAARIMEDGIDVLIDLSGHTRLNRLPVFARKPAPIQISWLGYPGTTGLKAMDYYFADRDWLPPGRCDRLFTEKLVHLPARWVFEPHVYAPAVGPLPALQTGHLTFGSFHRMEKISPCTQSLWSHLLLALPQTKMLLVGIATERQRDALRQNFAAQGVAADRLTFHERCPMNVYLELHHRVDIALDTQPYSGATTTMHSLSMGVPTFTVSGTTSQARACAGILGNLGLENFIAADADDLIDKARHWGDRLSELAALRAGLRARLQRSPIGQPAHIAGHFEAALRHMWIRWCSRLPAKSFTTQELTKTVLA